MAMSSVLNSMTTATVRIPPRGECGLLPMSVISLKNALAQVPRCMSGPQMVAPLRAMSMVALDLPRLAH